NTEHINHFSSDSLDNLLGQFGYTCCVRERVKVSGESGFAFPSLEAGYAAAVSPSAFAWKLDPDFRTSMESYIEKSSVLMASLNRQIGAALSQSRDVILWGTGQLAMKLLRESELARANILAFVDGNSVNHGRKLRGVAVSPPEKVNPSGAPVLVATLLHTEAIEARIRALGWKNRVITLSVQ